MGAAVLLTVVMVLAPDRDLKNHSGCFSDTQNGREGGENTGSAVLPSLRISNTFTSKT
jgi:hypothetical protein